MQTLHDGLENTNVTQLLVEKKSITESLLNKYKIVWTTDRGGDKMIEYLKKPYNRFDAPCINGKGLYKRILIQRIN